MLDDFNIDDDPQFKLNGLNGLQSVIKNERARVEPLQPSAKVNTSHPEIFNPELPRSETTHVNKLVETVQSLRSSIILERRPPTMIERPIR